MDWEAFYARFRETDFVPGYEILNRLGGGAFGEVYKARKHSIGKSFAIKFLKVGDDSARAAIERELEQVRHFAAIDHPNLVTIEDLGSVMGVPYLVMGYAGDRTLAQALRAGRLSREEALRYFAQVARGVAALHDLRLAHFDLKPGNIFLKGDEARVGDYGLSRLLGEGRMTLSFSRGTPHYMAPEMLMARGDERADIYSLGVILYECLSGKLPFESEIPGAIPLRDRDEPPPFPPDFPEDLRGIVERCLRLSPADRYPSVHALLSELEALGALEGLAEPLPPQRRADRELPLQPLSLDSSTPRVPILASATLGAEPEFARLGALGAAASGAGAVVGVREVLRELWVASRDLFRSLCEGFLGRTPPPDWLEEAPRRMREVIPLPPSARLRGLELPLSVILLAFEVLAGLVRGIYLSVRYDLHNSSQRDSRSSRGYSLAVRALWLLFVLLLVGTIVAFVVLMLAGEEWTG